MARQRIKRPIVIDGEVAFVPLTKGYVAIVDAADVPMLQTRNWFAEVLRGGQVYAKGAGFVDGRWLMEKMHRVILGAAPGTEVDHFDMNTLNNRRSNLRFCTRSLNLANKRVRRDSASGIKGVFLHKPSGRYRAKIKYRGRQIHIGYYATKESASAAYAVKAAELFGEFARVG